MTIAQQLYEGVKIENSMTGLITYMRTDSTRMSDDGLKMIRDYIAKNYSKITFQIRSTYMKVQNLLRMHMKL